jgi:hypothetical protein
MGRYLTVLHGLKLVISLYELSSDSDIQSLRIVIYEIQHCQSIEYRLSPLERLALFSKDKPVLEQILERMKAVYCNVLDKTRAFLLLGKEFKPQDRDFEVEGDNDFDIIIHSFDDESVEKAVDDLDSKANISAETSAQSPNDVMNLDDNSSHNSFQVNANAGVDPFQSLGSSQWAWVLYFDRTAVNMLRGNMTISVGFNASQRGFAIYALDNRSLWEAYRFVTLEQSCTVLYDFNMNKLMGILRSLDESVLFDILDELISTVSITKSLQNEAEYLLELRNGLEGDDEKSIFIAKLVNHIETEKDLQLQKRKLKVIPPANVDIVILECKDLTPNGSLQIRFIHYF